MTVKSDVQMDSKKSEAFHQFSNEFDKELIDFLLDISCEPCSIATSESNFEPGFLTFNIRNAGCVTLSVPWEAWSNDITKALREKGFKYSPIFKEFILTELKDEDGWPIYPTNWPAPLNEALAKRGWEFDHTSRSYHPIKPVEV